MQSANLDTLEQRSYRTTVDHGFFDLLLAAAVAVFVLVFTVSKWWVLALFPLILGKRWLLGIFNRAVVEPRVGHVRLGPARLDQISTARKMTALAFFGLSLIIARLGEMAVSATEETPLVWLAGAPQFQMAIVAGVATAVAGWLFELPRFTAYGVVVALLPLLAAVTGLPAGTGWALAALTILAAGCGVLFRFLRRNPEAGA